MQGRELEVPPRAPPTGEETRWGRLCPWDRPRHADERGAAHTQTCAHRSALVLGPVFMCCALARRRGNCVLRVVKKGNAYSLPKKMKNMASNKHVFIDR